MRNLKSVLHQKGEVTEAIKFMVSKEFFRGSRTLSRREVKRQSKVEIRTAMKNEIWV